VARGVEFNTGDYAVEEVGLDFGVDNREVVFKD
jgi:hypothetical protein